MITVKKKHGIIFKKPEYKFKYSVVFYKRHWSFIELYTTHNIKLVPVITHFKDKESALIFKEKMETLANQADCIHCHIELSLNRKLKSEIYNQIADIAYCTLGPNEQYQCLI